MFGGLCESKVRCIDTIPNTSRFQGGIGADKNCTGPEKALRAREKAACWHNQHNLGMLTAFAYARSGPISLTPKALMHFLQGFLSVWLDCVASMRKFKERKRCQEGCVLASPE